MGEQSVDLRSTVAILRRHRRTLAGAAAAGAAAGVCSVLLWPPMYTSHSQVLLPPPTQDANGQTTSRDVQTDVRIATSDVVLGPAGRAMRPRMSVREVARQVKVRADTPAVLWVEAKAPTPAGARALSAAVANSEVTFVTVKASSLTNVQQKALGARQKELQKTLDTVNAELKKTTARHAAEDPASAEGKSDATALSQLTAEQASLVLQIDQLKHQVAAVQPTGGASIIEHATPAERPLMAERFLAFAMLGLLVFVAITATVLAVFGRRDRRLRYRDEMADAVGSAVIASVGSRVPKSAAGWTSLLERYAPGTVDAWALRQALRQLAPGQPSTRSHQGSDEHRERAHEPLSVTVITLSDDPRALAVGPQIASYAASTGVSSRLVAAQGHWAAAPLWAACSRPRGDEVTRPGLRVDTRPAEQHEVDLTVVLAVVDRRKPELRDLPETSATILAVSPGSATAEELARVAVTADDTGRRIDGIIVADPDDLDRTTGRLLQHERSQQVPLPARLTGMADPKTSQTNVSGIRRRPG